MSATIVPFFSLWRNSGSIVSDLIIYEQPLNERIRIFLRLEFLFADLDAMLALDTEQANRHAIQTLGLILTVFERSDLKQEIIKELDRLVMTLTAMAHLPGVDTQALEDLLQELDQSIDALHLNKAPIGQALRDDDFFYSIRQRATIPGGSCDFDLPAYHYWLRHRPDSARKQQLQQWSKEFDAVRSAIQITLKLIRGSTGFSSATAPGGFYQHSLNRSQSNQMIRVQLPKAVPFFPEISGGKHRFTIRFMQFEMQQRPRQFTEDVTFSLSCCVI